MNTFEKDYEQIKQYCKKRINFLKLNSIDVDEIINDSYIQLVESKQEYNYDIFIKLCYKNIEYLKSGSSTVTLLENPFNKKQEAGTADFYRYCTKCKLPKTKDEFYEDKVYVKNGKTRKQSFARCRKCLNEISTKNQANKSKEYKSLASKKHSKKGNIRRQRGRDKLEDWYVIQALASEIEYYQGISETDARKYIQANYHLVEEKRQKMKKRRERIKSKKPKQR